ncbi:PilW family protein [Anaerosphaera multitolerans]|uniref:PilW family protein n=1 Tax=Anaerosphaera multitolerans TaxID=2487351 RepID=UPI0013E31524|nr:type II secretion system protein [Anaerosphaera multitolerans]
MRLYLKKFYRLRGFTLIELIIVLGISVLIFPLLYSLLGMSLKTLNTSNRNDLIFNDTYFTFNYIADEINSADYIVEDCKRNSLGFAIVNCKNEKGYRYVYYVFDGKRIARKAVNIDRKFDINVDSVGTFGTNTLINNVKNVSCTIKENLIKLNIVVFSGNYEREFEKIIAIRTF